MVLGLLLGWPTILWGLGSSHCCVGFVYSGGFLAATWVVSRWRGLVLSLGVFPFLAIVTWGLACLLGFLILAIPCGETSEASTKLDFRSECGLKLSAHGGNVFDNTLFSLETKMNDLGPTSGSQITKINGCLERCKERPKLIILMEMLANDIE